MFDEHREYVQTRCDERSTDKWIDRRVTSSSIEPRRTLLPQVPGCRDGTKRTQCVQLHHVVLGADRVQQLLGLLAERAARLAEHHHARLAREPGDLLAHGGGVVLPGEHARDCLSAHTCRFEVESVHWCWGFVKLVERCSDGVEVQGAQAAEEAFRGQERPESSCPKVATFFSRGSAASERRVGLKPYVSLMGDTKAS